mmetsp:Transcript_9776/g.17759  ORF Transcript_9776/g.17759 Transcript_9776/m.17759 type:complete len:303 (-) Transcript_9776:510-1418(-)
MSMLSSSSLSWQGMALRLVTTLWLGVGARLTTHSPPAPAFGRRSPGASQRRTIISSSAPTIRCSLQWVVTKQPPSKSTPPIPLILRSLEASSTSSSTLSSAFARVLPPPAASAAWEKFMVATAMHGLLHPAGEGQAVMELTSLSLYMGFEDHTCFSPSKRRIVDCFLSPLSVTPATNRPTPATCLTRSPGSNLLSEALATIEIFPTTISPLSLRKQPLAFLRGHMAVTLHESGESGGRCWLSTTRATSTATTSVPTVPMRAESGKIPTPSQLASISPLKWPRTLSSHVSLLTTPSSSSSVAA